MVRQPFSLLSVPRLRLVPLVAAAFLTRGIAAHGAASDTFQPVGNLVEARDSAQATLLTDGTVLVAGGFHNSQDLGSAELFDPKTNQFSALPSMASPRSEGLRAVRLQDGRVLVTGGFDNENDLSSAEVFDPALRVWKAVGPMPLDRGDHTATLLPDGRVLVAGGWSNSQLGPTGEAELFDPATGTFQKTGSLRVPRYRHAAVALPDGRVVLLGGYSFQNQAVGTVEIYDPNTGVFTLHGTLVQGRGDLTASLLPDGRILVVGGDSLPGLYLVPTPSVEIYDPATGRSTVTGAMADARAMHAAAPLPDGRILAVGGGSGLNAGTALSTTALVDPTTGKVSPAAPMTTARLAPAAVALPDGRVLVIGGARSDLTSLDTAEAYVPGTGANPAP